MNLGLDKLDLCFVIYMFLSNNPSSGDINSSNLPCLLLMHCFDFSKSKMISAFKKSTFFKAKIIKTAEIQPY